MDLDLWTRLAGGFVFLKETLLVLGKKLHHQP